MSRFRTSERLAIVPRVMVALGPNACKVFPPARPPDRFLSAIRTSPPVSSSDLPRNAGLPFDPAIVEGVRMNTDGLATIGTPDPDEPGEAQYDDVDDYHGVARSVTRAWYNTDLVFTDSVSVRYVLPADPDGVLPAAQRTLAKEVALTVFAAPVGFVGSPPIGAQLRQVVTPTSQAPYRN